MAGKRPLKLWIILGVIGVIFLIAGVQGIRYWWNRGYSNGERTGTVRKVSVKGPPYCKYLEGELVLAGANNATLQSEVWTFSVDDDSEKNPIVMQLKEAEKNGTRVTLHYRQDQGSMYRCTPSEYFVTKVEK
jgi:hypothetical protein